jgi:NADH-quinone oxidoreductase subunit I
MSLDIIKGMATTLKNIGKKPTTVSYPEEERELPARFRGRHVLHRYEDGLERCVGCYLCAGACPADAIYIEAEENSDQARVSAGERYAKVFDVNILRCIFCGYCQAACPTGAITLEKDYKLASYHAEDMVYHKEMLLEPDGQATIGSAAVWLDPPPPLAQAPQPMPQETNVFDGSWSSSSAVGLGTLKTEREVLVANPEQDHDRRLLQHAKSSSSEDTLALSEKEQKSV